MFDYSRALPREAVRVRFCLDSDAAHRAHVTSHLATAGQRYGFTLEQTTIADVTRDHSRGQIEHVIVLTNRRFDPALTQWAVSTLGHVDTVSLGFAYADDAEMLSYENLINQAKSENGDRVNFLRPDEMFSGILRVSDQKIVDNAVCDSVRVKYVPVQSTIPSGDLISSNMLEFFSACSRAYADLHLYHRSPTDGYFAVRAGGGFAITATKTKKIHLDPRRISFVHCYDRNRNEIHYSGQFLPSSDAVEAAMVFSAFPEITALYHSHASALFTRNPAFAARRLVASLPYGDPSLGDALVDALGRVEDGFIIMEEHGEVFAERNADPLRVIERINQMASIRKGSCFAFAR